MGGTLPESFYQTIHQAVDMQSGKETTIRLADYRNKLIILDFWASWCAPCVHSLNKFEDMKKDLGNDGYIVIPVTYQQIAEASRTYEKHQWGLTSIVADTVLGRVFPHRSIPHMVWIKRSEKRSVGKEGVRTCR